MIDEVLTGPTLNFKSTAREPCLYRGEIDGDSVFLLCQVDNFAVVSLLVDIANKLFAHIQADFNL